MGNLLRRLVDAEGIRSLTIEILDETRESFTVLENATGQEYRFVLPGPRVSEAECHSCLEALTSLKQRPEFLVASGSLPPGIPEDFYAHIIRLAKGWGTRVFLDSSGPALKAALAAGVFLIKPNLSELSGLIGFPLENLDSWLKACHGIVERGDAEIVALTLGERGALLVTRDRAWRAQVAPVRPVSAVGAGDSFLGAMVWSLASGDDLETAFRYGVASGTAALLTPGTELCHRQDVERLYREVSVEPVPVPHHEA
jgi:6-phosphofructokinase 2